MALTRNTDSSVPQEVIDAAEVLRGYGYTAVSNEDLMALEELSEKAEKAVEKSSEKEKTHNPFKKCKRKYESLDKDKKKTVKIVAASVGGVAVIGTTAAIIHHHHKDDRGCSSYTDMSFNY